jgi:hypothetical protein
MNDDFHIPGGFVRGAIALLAHLGTVAATVAIAMNGKADLAAVVFVVGTIASAGYRKIGQAELQAIAANAVRAMADKIDPGDK